VTLWGAALTSAAVLTLGTAAPAAAAEPTKIVMSYSQKVPDYLPVWIAADAGYFKKHGLDMTLRYLPAREGVPALLTNQVQIAGIGASDVASAQAQGAKFKLVLTLSPVYTFQFWARPEYANAKALKGQRVGITSTTGSLYAGTLLALKALGMTTSDVIITPLGAATNVNNALLSGRIAAGCSHPPATYKFQKAGMVNLVDLPKKNIPAVSDGIWLSESYVQAHHDVVQKVVDALMDAWKREQSDREYAEKVLGKNLGIKDKAELDFTYDFYANEVLGPGPMPTAEQVQSNIDALATSNAKVKTLNAASMIDQSFIKAAMNKKP
jgi:NitT/TauT family transport system substrate-binding protein